MATQQCHAKCQDIFEILRHIIYGMINNYCLNATLNHIILVTCVVGEFDIHDKEPAYLILISCMQQIFLGVSILIHRCIIYGLSLLSVYSLQNSILAACSKNFELLLETPNNFSADLCWSPAQNARVSSLINVTWQV